MKKNWIVAMIAVLSIMANAETYYVDFVKGSDENEGTEASAPLKTIREAIDLADEDDASEILLFPGVHVLDSALLIDKPITLKSISGKPLDTVIAGESFRRVMYLQHQGAVVIGVTLRGGGAGENAGGNVYMSDGRLDFCVLESGSARQGGNVYMENGTIENCVFFQGMGFNEGSNLMMRRGQVRHCLFIGGVCEGWYGWANGGSIYASGGKLTNFRIVDTTCLVANDYCGSALYLTGEAQAENGLITGSFGSVVRNGTHEHAASVALSENASALRLTITDNVAGGKCVAGVWLNDAAVLASSDIGGNRTDADLPHYACWMSKVGSEGGFKSCRFDTDELPNDTCRGVEVAGASVEILSDLFFKGLPEYEHPISDRVYVNATAVSGGDGKSWATAFSDPFLAVATAPDYAEIVVADGVYLITNTISIKRPLRFASASGEPEKCVFKPAPGKNLRLFELNHSGAVLDGITAGFNLVEGALGAVVFIGNNGGKVLNSIIRDAQVANGSNGALTADVRNGRALVSNCVVTNNELAGWNSPESHPGGKFSGRVVVTNSLFAGNVSVCPDKHFRRDNRMVKLSFGARMKGSTFTGNVVTGDPDDKGPRRYPGLWASESSLVNNSFFYGNEAFGERTVAAVNWYGATNAFVQCGFDGELPNAKCEKVAAVNNGKWKYGYTPVRRPAICDQPPAPKPIVVRYDPAGNGAEFTNLYEAVELAPEHSVLILPKGTNVINRTIWINRPITITSASGKADSCILVPQEGAKFQGVALNHPQAVVKGITFAAFNNYGWKGSAVMIYENGGSLIDAVVRDSRVHSGEGVISSAPHRGGASIIRCKLLHNSLAEGSKSVNCGIVANRRTAVVEVTEN